MTAAPATLFEAAQEEDREQAAMMSAVAGKPLDLRRMSQIARGGPTDHAGDVVAVSSPSFAMDTTIFRKMSGLSRIIWTNKIDKQFFWCDAAVGSITAMYASVPKPLQHDKALVDFMGKECDFSLGHADGSFMDHLQFCYEYSAANFPQQSPRVLLLHSIMGVTTNDFPMDVAKVPKLKELVNDSEFRHIEAFPSIQRLILNTLLDTLQSHTPAQLERLQSISFHRVIDNQPLRMGAPDFWVHLNYHLMHWLDFLPTKDWDLLKNDHDLDVVARLHALLLRGGKLMAKVDLGLKPLIPSCENLPGMPVTLGSVLRRFASKGFLQSVERKQQAEYSAEIGHDLSYELDFETETKARAVSKL